MRFKNWFIVSKNELVGHVIWYGQYSVCEDTDGECTIWIYDKAHNNFVEYNDIQA